MASTKSTRSSSSVSTTFSNRQRIVRGVCFVVSDTDRAPFTSTERDSVLAESVRPRPGRVRRRFTKARNILLELLKPPQLHATSTPQGQIASRWPDVPREPREERTRVFARALYGLTHHDQPAFVTARKMKGKEKTTGRPDGRAGVVLPSLSWSTCGAPLVRGMHREQERGI